MLGGRDDLIPAVEAFAESVTNLRKVKVNDKVESGTDTLTVFHGRFAGN